MKVLVFGTFDGVHPGHRFVFDHALKRGDLYVVVARDATVERIKGRRPKHHEAARVQSIATLYPTARVTLGHPTDFRAPLRDIAPDLILLGYDQRLPPGVSEADFAVPVERLPAFHPEKYKSSLL